MIHTSKFINKNFRIKVSGIDNEGNRINKLVGVSGLLNLIGETLADKFVTRAFPASSKLALALKKASSGVICFSSIQITIYQSQK